VLHLQLHLSPAKGMPYTLLKAMKLLGSTLVRSSKNTISMIGSFPARHGTRLQAMKRARDKQEQE
jgi:hypothetical protein